MKKAFAGDPRRANCSSPTAIRRRCSPNCARLAARPGAAVSAYLDLVGNRLIDGFDIAEPTALEMPDALLRSIRIAVAPEEKAASDTDARIAQIRAKVPAAQQKEFDELLGEARRNYRLRDERGVYSDIWASGLMRRAALAAGAPRRAQAAAWPSPSTWSMPASMKCARW